MRRSELLIATLLLLTGVACRSDRATVSVVDATDATNVDSTTVSSTEPTRDSDRPVVTWEKCGAVMCGELDAPLDYSDPRSATITIHLEMRPARRPDERIGSLLMNPGGPGFGGAILARVADNFLSDDLLDRFDIIGFDPRGTGESEPHVDCTDDYDRYFGEGDITPDTPEEVQFNIDLVKEFVDLCLAKNGDFIDFIGTNNAARDMDRIRQALGEDKISYFGLSYGSELGAAWATLFPGTVRAAVLDGAADPNVDPVRATIEQSIGFESALDRFLADCSKRKVCAFHSGGDAEGAFDALMARIDEDPLPTTKGRPSLDRGIALTGVAEALYDDLYWPDLAEALAAADDGDGEPLLQLYDRYFQRNPDGTYGNELEAFVAITCADQKERPTIEEADSHVPEYQRAAPRMSPDTQGNYGCTFFPPAIDPRVTITGRGAGPIVVIGTTGDPSTPLAGTRSMARALEGGRLIIVDANQHTGYATSACARDAVDRYLVDLKPPESDLEC